MPRKKSEKEEKKPDWKMPEWMEKYRDCFNNTGGNTVEELMNFKGNAKTNMVLSTLCVAVSSQVYLLESLHKKGYLK